MNIYTVTFKRHGDLIFKHECEAKLAIDAYNEAVELFASSLNNTGEPYDAEIEADEDSL